MDERMAKRNHCYYCKKFISNDEAFRNWGHIQHPGVMDPEPYEIMWCDACGITERNFLPGAHLVNR